MYHICKLFKPAILSINLKYSRMFERGNKIDQLHQMLGQWFRQSTDEKKWEEFAKTFP